ncbi:MAG: hypothetical protein IJ231_09820 [Clostridia bacterium]|nr:hypothetical protein [Clostridia bacterium]
MLKTSFLFLSAFAVDKVIIPRFREKSTTFLQKVKKKREENSPAAGGTALLHAFRADSPPARFRLIFRPKSRRPAGTAAYRLNKENH